ncbi:MAG: MFS transporter [Pseudomonadota bacterium]
MYLIFVVEVLTSHGYSAAQASALGSVPSWIMVFSAVAAGQLVDRTGQRDLVLYGGLIISAVCLVLLSQGAAVTVNIVLLGTVGFGCAGVIMSLTADAMPAQSRAFGMGFFFTIYFIVGLPAPGIAGWLYDLTTDPSAPMLFASALCLLAAACNLWFRRSLSTPP